MCAAFELSSNPQPSPALIVTPWYGSGYGGVAVATESLVHALKAAGGSVAVVRLAPDGLIPKYSRGSAGEEVVDVCLRDDRAAERSILHRGGFHLRQSTARRVLRRLIDRHGIRVAHFHFAESTYAVWMRLARDAGLGVVSTFHGSDVNAADDPAAATVVRDMVRSSDQVAVVSQALRDRLLDRVPEVVDRLSVVYNAVPPSFEQALSIPRTNASAAFKWDALLVGNLFPVKGGDLFVQALAQVLPHLPNARVALAGRGPFEQELRAHVARLGLEGHVDFLGQLSRDQILDAYRSAKMLVIPSRSEGLPLVLLEAQWLGIPVVASAVGGIPEAITNGENGLLIDAEDVDGLARGMVRVLTDDTLRHQLGTNARATVRDRFAPSVMVQRYGQIYRTARASARSRHGVESTP